MWWFPTTANLSLRRREFESHRCRVFPIVFLFFFFWCKCRSPINRSFYWMKVKREMSSHPLEEEIIDAGLGERADSMQES